MPLAFENFLKMWGQILLELAGGRFVVNYFVAGLSQEMAAPNRMKPSIPQLEKQSKETSFDNVLSFVLLTKTKKQTQKDIWRKQEVIAFHLIKLTHKIVSCSLVFVLFVL